MVIEENICKLTLLLSLIGTVTCFLQLEFRCQGTGRTIPGCFTCDGRKDCPNGEDEIYGCSNECMSNSCGTNHPTSTRRFACDQQCKELSIRCNGIKDCEDGTDELNCGHINDVKNCTSESKFLCKDGLRCLELYETCDYECHCLDCSDEDDFNCDKEDFDLVKECPDSYFTTAKGPKCFCDSRNEEFRAWCDLIKPCTNSSFNYCAKDQRCRIIGDSAQCTCFEGSHLFVYEYQRNSWINNKECRKNDWRETVIVYATEDEIKLVNLTSNTALTIKEKVYNITALSTANNYIYYALQLPSGKGCIFKTPLHSGKSENIIDTGFNITSLAVDYITNNMYFTTNGSLSVCKNDGSTCLKLDCCDISVVALAPKSGMMFFLRKEQKLNGLVLTKSSMAGDNKTTSMDKVYHGDLFSLVVDEAAAKLYLLEIIYATGISQIHEISFNTGLVEKLIISASSIRTFGTYGNKIFFTSWEMNHKNSHVIRSKGRKTRHPGTSSNKLFVTDWELNYKNSIFWLPLIELPQIYPDWYHYWLPYYIGDDDNSTNINHLNVYNGIFDNSNEMLASVLNKRKRINWRV